MPGSSIPRSALQKQNLQQQTSFHVPSCLSFFLESYLHFADQVNQIPTLPELHSLKPLRLRAMCSVLSVSQIHQVSDHETNSQAPSHRRFLSPGSCPIPRIFVFFGYSYLNYVPMACCTKITRLFVTALTAASHNDGDFGRFTSCEAFREIRGGALKE